MWGRLKHVAKLPIFYEISVKLTNIVYKLTLVNRYKTN